MPFQDNREEHEKPLTQVHMSVQVCVIRDGTQGISLSIGKRVIGQWTDSRAASVLLTDDLKVAICGPSGNRLYLFSVPGETLSGRQVSDTEVLVTFTMD